MSGTTIDGLPHALSAHAVVAALGSDAAAGLSSGEAERRLDIYGPNTLEERKPVSVLRKLLNQFSDSLVLLLIVAAGISGALWWIERDSPAPLEAFAILAIVLLNAVMGYVQQERADQAAAALRQMTAKYASVKRDGETTQIPATKLVPGDILLVEEGETIAADARLIASAGLQVAEAPLTGESIPVEKSIEPVPAAAELADRVDMLFSGTAATGGHGRAIITATGERTEFGRIAGLLAATKDTRTPLQLELDRVGKWLGAIVIFIATIMIATLYLTRDVSGMAATFQIFILGVALAVAAVPEGLPAIVTVVLSIGVQRMARRNAIVRTLAAVESLGSADIIATDKTGTLTRNEMTLRTMVTASGIARVSGTGYAPSGEVRTEDGQPPAGALQAEVEALLIAGGRANNAALIAGDGRWMIRGDPTEGALVVAARKAGLDADILEKRLPRVAEVPFSSERKLMSTVHRETDGSAVVFTKGAPDVLLGLCTGEWKGGRVGRLERARRDEILQAVEEIAAQGLRPLGLARRSIADACVPAGAADIERDLVFLGLVGIMDPPRDEARAAVEAAHRAGIRPIMITGDHPATARAIAAELGMDRTGAVATGHQIGAMTDDELGALVRRTSIYARVAPEHKLRIVQALQQHGLIVAMTGDGVNDAPALKTADIGVAMGVTGTDVAKAAADIVLADDNFATIVAAIEEGRGIFANIRKFLSYLLSSNIAEVATMFLGLLLAGRIGLSDHADGAFALPLLAVQILWINLITDGAPALALGLDRVGGSVMDRPPRHADEKVITPAMWLRIVASGSLMALGTLGMFDASLPGGLIAGDGSLAYAQTMAFTTLVLFQLLNAVVIHAGSRSVFGGHILANRWLWLALGLSLLLQVGVVEIPLLQAAFSTVPLDAEDWLRCVAVASAIIWVREIGLAAGFLGARLRPTSHRAMQGALESHAAGDRPHSVVRPSKCS
ncbi:cation-translocating P-type ATPase (plasmid) [Sphingobium naphthae]|uniref:cation-translocating P-type ATPase n=1 Tax=Sphingobium naphthae TaxID=1886786 RepID=UPI000C992F40|nr:haloacid dehalogenase [Erythrobacter sp.]MEA3390989.1 cation-translocating P-type ATPase [Pseudomonadota bacterium]